jgi:hypothetical protein
MTSFEELLSGSGSAVREPMVAALATTAPAGVAELTVTTRVKLPVAALAKLGWVAVTVPVPPGDGVAAVQPAGAVNDTNAVLAGRTSVKVTSTAASGPSLVTVRV